MIMIYMLYLFEHYLMHFAICYDGYDLYAVVIKYYLMPYFYFQIIHETKMTFTSAY